MFVHIHNNCYTLILVRSTEPSKYMNGIRMKYIEYINENEIFTKSVVDAKQEQYMM